MKIKYNYGQEFTLEEIDMYNNELVFKTTNSMGKFSTTGIKMEVIFKVPFESIYELQNIPKLLNDYLDKNNLIYWCD